MLRLARHDDISFNPTSAPFALRLSKSERGFEQPAKPAPASNSA